MIYYLTNKLPLWVVGWVVQTARDFSSSSYDPKADPNSTNFKLTKDWKSSAHPLLLFNSDGSGSITPLWMKPSEVVTANQMQLLQQWGFNFPNFVDLDQV